MIYEKKRGEKMKRVHKQLFNRLRFICSGSFIEHKESNEYHYFTNKSFIEIEFFSNKTIVVNSDFNHIYKLSNKQYNELLNICLQSVIKTA